MTTPGKGRTLWINGDRDPGHAYQVSDPSFPNTLEDAMAAGKTIRISVDGGEILYLNCSLVTQVLLSADPPVTTQGIH